MQSTAALRRHGLILFAMLLGCGGPSGAGGTAGTTQSGSAGTGGMTTTGMSTGGAGSAGASAGGQGGTTTQAGGSMSTGGNGGSAAGAGGDTSTGGTTTSSLGCLPGEASTSYPAVGLSSPDALFGFNVTMTVKAAAPDHLDLEGPNGEKGTFLWAGPDLTLHFAPGDTVEAKRSQPGTNGWSSVAGATVFAAAWHDGQWGVSIPPADPAPYSGPALNFSIHCIENNGDCTLSMYDLTASAGGASAIAKPDETVTVGLYQVHHAHALANGCMGEASYIAQATVLGPVPPP